MIVNVVLDERDSVCLEQIKQLKGNKSSAQTLREAVRFYKSFLFGENYQYIDNHNLNKITNDISIKSTDLPGLTAEVIQSHLVRFPKVTPEAYRGIIEELKRRQASEEGLKNPEAAAYGLCKRIQSGHADSSEAKKQEPTPSETADSSVPEDAFAYPPQF